jgi:hypothetical protein
MRRNPTCGIAGFLHQATKLQIIRNARKKISNATKEYDAVTVSTTRQLRLKIYSYDSIACGPVNVGERFISIVKEVVS